MAPSNKTKRSKDSNTTASAASKAPTLARAPSLSVLVETMRSQNSDKWDKIAQKADSNKVDSTTTASTKNNEAAAPSGAAVAAGGPASVVTTSALTASLAAHMDTAVDVASLDMNRRGSNASTSSSGTSAAPGTSIDGTPRLRLPARLAANASAPLLSRSQSTNAIVQSSALAPLDALDSTPAGSSISSSLMTTSASLGAGPASTAATSVGTTLPSSLCTTLARRGSLSNNGALPPSLPSNRGLPSLEAIGERFALKKGMEKHSDGPIAKSTETEKQDTPAVQTIGKGTVVAGALPPGLLTSTAVGKQVVTPPGVALLAGKTTETPSKARKENTDPETRLDSTGRTSAPSVHFINSQDANQSNISSHSLSVTASSSSSDSSVSPPTTPTDAAPLPLNRKAAALAAGHTAPDHPLEHKWTLYYDSRATARAAAAAAGKATTPTSATHSTASTPVHGNAGNKHQYEAGLSVLGSVQTVESFCRLYNWLKKPSRMGKDENLHFFKDGILPMWEDEHNKHGGKWTVCLDLKIGGVKELVDKLWMWLCFALIGEDFDEKDEIICGAVVSTRARMFRFQIWLKNREDTVSINAIGKQLIRILELQGPSNGNSGHAAARLPGMSLDFSYHGKGSPPPNKFVHISAQAFPAPSAAFQAAPGGSKMINPPPGIGSIGSGAASNTFNRPIGFGGASHHGNAFGSLGTGSGGNGASSSGLARAASMNAISAKLSGGGGAGGARESAQLSNGQPGPMNWRERLGQTPRKSSMAAS